MSRFYCPLVRILLLCASVSALEWPARAASAVPAGLRELATTAAQPVNWPRLREYAHSQTDPEWKAWAYLLVGYQEYNHQQFAPAARDLAQAAEHEFPLADYAVFYEASALRGDNQAHEGAAALQDFARRFPQSSLRGQALALQANALLATEQPQAAIDALNADPGTEKDPALALLLGQAYVQIHNALGAIGTFQNVYYNFPLSGQAKAASDALADLREQLGSAFPAASAELQTTRADRLLKAGHYAEALEEYENLLKSGINAPVAAEWQLGQARCLLHLHRSADAYQALVTHFAPPELEAQRLALLVEVHAQQADAPGMTQDLAQLDASFQSEPAYADALAAAGIFYYRQLNWQEAEHNYQRLWDLFPENLHLREDGWRLAWCRYLLGDTAASQTMSDYVKRFPDAARVPAALYWLGRLQEDHGSPAEARALYELLKKRFAQTYYATLATTRLAGLRDQGDAAAHPGDPVATPLASALIPLLATSPAVPPGFACPDPSPTGALRTAKILQALHVPDLEEEYIRSAVAEGHQAAELRLLLAQSYAAQNNASSALVSTVRAIPGYPDLEFTELRAEVWRLLYPQPYRALIRSQARLHKLNPYLVMGLIRQESTFDAHALSGADARGLMQILPETAAHSSRRSRVRLASRRLYSPTYNVRVGCAYLAGLMQQFNGRPELAMAAYHAGDFRVSDWLKKYSFNDPAVFLESIPIPATRAYVEQVLRDQEIYRQLSSGSARFARCSVTHAVASR